MKRGTVIFTLVLAITASILGSRLSTAQPPSMKRTELLRTDAAMEGKEAHLWVAEIAPGAATGNHAHPTPRFVYVIEGSVVLEIEGQAPRTVIAGQAFQELPGQVHNFRNASGTLPAKALGFQIAAKGQSLQ